MDESPKLGMNLTAQEWELWRSRWTGYKRYTGLTDPKDCIYDLRGCFSSRKLDKAAGNNGLDNNADLDEEQFLERARRLAVSLPGCYVKEVFSKEVFNKEVFAKDIFTK